MTVKPKVVHFLTDLGLGGTQKTAQLFCQYNAPCYDIHLIYNELHSTDRLASFKSFLGKGNLHPYKEINDAKTIFKELKPDITHVYRSGFPEFPSPSDCHSKHFVETNVFGMVNHDPQIDKTLFMSQSLMATAEVRYSHLFATNRKRFDYVNNPIECPVSNDVYLRVDLGIRNNTIILGRCGRPDNGVYSQLNVKAAAELIRQGYDIFFLVLAAPPAMKKDLLRLKVPHKCLDSTIDSKLLSKFYNTVDIYCHARPDGESFGSNIAEAMYHRKPIITHLAIPLSPDMGVFNNQTFLVQNGKNGFVSSSNELEYAQMVAKLINDPGLRKTMGDSSFLKASLECCMDATAGKVRKIYDGLLGS